MTKRIDGRDDDALRPVAFELGFTNYAEGSVLMQQGKTMVLCTATVTEKMPNWLRGQGRGWVTAEYALLPRSTEQRTEREKHWPKGRTMEIQRLIGRSLRAAVDLTELGERQIIVDCDVLQADGGTRTASVTAGYVVLSLALRRLVNAGKISAKVFRPAVTAVSAGLVDGRPLLDLCYLEDRRADVDANVVMTATNHFVEIQMTAEGETLSREQFKVLLDLAEKGNKELLRLQQAALLQAELPGR